LFTSKGCLCDSGTYEVQPRGVLRYISDGEVRMEPNSYIPKKVQCVVPEISIPPPKRVIGNSKGEGGLKGQHF